MMTVQNKICKALAMQTHHYRRRADDSAALQHGERLLA
jgi:hypothetical protein